MKIRYVLPFVAFCIFMLWLAAPTAEDVARCVDATGWSSDRCRVELTR